MHNRMPVCSKCLLDSRKNLSLSGILFRITQQALVGFRVVEVPMASNPTFVMLSSLKPLFFNSLKNEWCFLDNEGA